MGGPSKKEIQSAETLTAYIDGEITDKLLLELFESELSENPRLQSRLQNMVAIKSQISSISGTEGLRITEFVKNEIRAVVKSYQLTDAFKAEGDDGGAPPSDSEVLISKLIDGELANSELQMVEKLVTENDTYRELYEQLVTAKINISDNLFQENTGPSAKVKINIKSLVEHELGKSDDGGEQIEEAPRKLAGLFHRTSRMEPSSEASSEPTEPAQNVINLKKRGVVSSLNYYAQRLVPLAAVFVVGLVISPTLFSSGQNKIPGLGPLRGGGSEATLNESFNFISIVQPQNKSIDPEQKKLLLPQESFHLLLTAPTAGEMFITLETSSQNDVSKLEKGKTAYSVGLFVVGQSVRYPAAQNLSVGETDKLLRVDIEIRNNGKIFSFTEFVAINHGQVD